MSLDLVVRAARLLDGRVVDVGVRSGRIELVTSDFRPASPAVATVIDADGRLVTPAFINASAPRQGLHPAVARRPCDRRMHSGRDGRSEDAHRYGSDSEGAAELCEQALNLGADIVGGIPWIEHSQAEARQHVEWACRPARLASAMRWLGQDDIEDAYYPYGRNNMLEIAFLASHLLDFRSGTDQLRLLDMVTNQAARVLGYSGLGVQPGAPADLCVHDAERVVELIREHAAPRWVISRWRVVAETTSTTRFYLTTQAAE